jgi:hypothetical protein
MDIHSVMTTATKPTVQQFTIVLTMSSAVCTTTAAYQYMVAATTTATADSVQMRSAAPQQYRYLLPSTQQQLLYSTQVSLVDLVSSSVFLMEGVYLLPGNAITTVTAFTAVMMNVIAIVHHLNSSAFQPDYV